mgnify:CR=1 FL=1
MNIEVFGVLVAGFLTLCIYSFLYKDNPLYRFAEYLFVGVSAGYTLSRAFHDVFDKLIWGPLVDPAPGATTDWAILIPVILGIFLILKLVPQVSWLSRWALAFVVGGTIGLSMTSRFKSDVMEQIKATIAPFAATEMSASELHSRAIYLGEDLKAESNYEGVNEFYQFYYRYLMVELRGKTSLSGSSLDRFKELNALEQEILKSEKEMLGELIHWLDSSQKEMVEAGDFFRTEVTRLENDLAEYMVNGAEGSSRRETINGLYEISEALQLKGIDEAMYQQSFESIKVLAAALKNSHVNYLKGDQSPNAGLDLTAWKDLQKERWLFFAEYTKALKDLGVQSEALLGLIDGKFASTESTEAGLVALVGMKNQVNRRVALLGTLLQADLTQPAPGRWKELLYGFIIAVISLTILIYFFFSTEHTGVVGVSATFGIYFLMICFGSSFGFTIMARISLLIGRVSFLIGKFWDTLVKLFTGGG